MQGSVQADLMVLGVVDAALAELRGTQAPVDEIAQHGVLRTGSLEELYGRPVDGYFHGSPVNNLRKIQKCRRNNKWEKHKETYKSKGKLGLFVLFPILKYAE